MKGKFILLISQMVKSAGLFKLVVRYDSFILVSFFIDLLIEGWQSPSKIHKSTNFDEAQVTL